MKVTITMDYSNLFLTNELIENVFKISQKPTKRIGSGLASLVKSGAEKMLYKNVINVTTKQQFTITCTNTIG